MHAGKYNSLAKHGHDPLSLDKIRGILNRLEDTIIFALIERAQFAYNQRIYQPRAFEELTRLGFDGSWLEWFIFGVESFHGKLLLVTGL
jgi:chorismate mutase